MKRIACTQCFHVYEQRIEEMVLRPKTEAEINAAGGMGALCVHTRVIAQDKAEIGGPDYMFHEHAGGGGLLVKNPGHTCAGIEQHANVEHHIAMVGKEFDGLLLPIFEHPEFSLVKLAGWLAASCYRAR